MKILFNPFTGKFDYTKSTLASSDFKNQGGTTTVLHGNAAGNPAWGQVVEADISLSNNSTNNVSATKHGFTPILSNNAAQFLDGQGNWSTPTAGAANSYSLTTFTGQTTVNVVHNFATYPNVQVIDNTGAVIIPVSITNNTVNDFTVVFTVATTGSIIATVGSPQPQAVKEITTTYTILTTDRILHVTTAGLTLTLPAVSGNTGREFIVDNGSTGDIILEANGSELIEGELNQTLPTNSAINVYCTGTDWRIY